MTYHLFRKNGGEQISVSQEANKWPEIDLTFWGVVINPPTPDGTEFPKIFDGTQIRNPTQVELDNFPLARVQDINLLDRNQAAGMLDDSKPQGKIIKALAAVMTDEINILRAEHSLPTRTLSQLKVAIKNKLNNGDAD